MPSITEWQKIPSKHQGEKKKEKVKKKLEDKEDRARCSKIHVIIILDGENRIREMEYLKRSFSTI